MDSCVSSTYSQEVLEAAEILLMFLRGNQSDRRTSPESGSSAERGSPPQHPENPAYENHNYNNGAASEHPRPRVLQSPEPPLRLGSPASPESTDSAPAPDEHEPLRDVEEIYARRQQKEEEMVPIGSGRTTISREKYKKIKWDTYTKATRGLLVAVFSRGILATHSLTGKKSPAFLDKPAKHCLDPTKVADIIDEVINVFNIKKSLVRSVITTKCADESKMSRTRQGGAGEPNNNMSDDQDSD